ncbi:TPA_asm: RNA-directed RNA polymerase [ssRNA phage Gerhypos.1_5]|jgi:hypothetical protein|uniref:RNA-directed RNA polymerase n=2 Tax=Norzivirales TaxID=2842247 RepID=A0A8S5L203_9VIRU|nr:RNA-directed RNA polymerase [ssRNA phage Gerhypos.1_5]QDH90799.1 MAG: RNA-dependent RNA polymerase [Leviviridae sp.]DAD51632.1 TPA_asm: RNA-directed RNA polymerase [ssRNA phage Gerhypos.1_5]
MGTSPVALYEAIYADVQAYSSLGPVAPHDLPPDVSYRQAASSVLLSTLLKKYLPEDTTVPDAEAVKKFLASNKKCRDWQLPSLYESDRLLLGEFRREVESFLHPAGSELVSSWFDILKSSRTGPGSALGARANSFYAKMCASKLTSTSPYLYEIYKDYSQWFPLFSSADAIRSEKFGDVEIVDGSRFHLVPKTKDISRMICVEPSLNMFFQLGLGTILEERLRTYFNIDLTTQPAKNRQLAYLGSKDQSYCTIDLSSASDSISLRMLESFLPKWFFDLLLQLRVPSTYIDGQRVGLYMMSTMGNGFTFPLQTFIFSCLIRAAYSVSGLSINDHFIGQNWACFGDDIICKREAYRNVCRLLDLLGFSINDSKSFSEGPFRESCGTDWFNGQPIRGVYIRKLRSPQDHFVAINLLNGWSAYTGIPLIRGVQFLLNQVPKSKISWVPFDEGNEVGVRIPSLLLPEGVRRDSNLSILYRGYRSRTVSFRIGDGVIRSPRGLKSLIFNPSGVYLSLLLGELVSGSISTRHSRVRYHLRWRCTPFWDYIPYGSLTNGYRLSWQQWETAVFINLNNP